MAITRAGRSSALDIATRDRRDTGLGAMRRLEEDGRHGWICSAPDEPGVERIEAFFGGRAYAMHSHSTYAIGMTLAGVQSFHYRGETRNSLAGGTMVLHPDEKHDGQSGTDSGFHYRMIYIEPAAIQAILRGKSLPFVPGGLSNDARLARAVSRLLRGMDDSLEQFEYENGLYDLVKALESVSDGTPTAKRKMIDYASAERARAFLHGVPPGVTLAALEQVAGRDRWSLSRDFRALFGTSPYRYLTFRRLAVAKAAMRAGQPLAQAAIDAGFADQSHMTRQFGAAFGFSPARWLNLQRA